MPATQLETITLAGGCFWCLEAVYERVDGVTAVESGYSNGHVLHPSYEQVCSGDTGHDLARAIEFLIASGHPPEAVWSCTPRRLAAWLDLAALRRRDEDADRLTIGALAARGEPKAVEGVLKKLGR